ncbi:MAG: signal recognition particle protein [Chloroflexi bacterium]|nr:signal recognition particle protein [Chloroflexota bacterium]
MLEALSEKLQGVFRKLGSRGSIREEDLDEALRGVRVALLEADVNFKVVREFIAGVRERALGEAVLQSLTGPQQVIGIVNDELVRILGENQAGLEPAKKGPTAILLVGPKGSGKTTTAAKLALHLRKQGQKPLLVAADPHRVAAGEQLQALGRQLNVPVSGGDGEAKPKAVAKTAREAAQRHGATTLIVDTTGHTNLDDAEALAELKELRNAFSPTETLLVVDAMTGQEAVNIALEIDEALGITGFIMTKMDGDARGGAALSIRAVTGLPIKFIGVGEKTDALEAFIPDRFASRILGMGDIVSLVEKANEAIGQEDVERLERKLRTQTLDLEDFIIQIQQMKRMGPISQLVDMIPGLASVKSQLNLDQVDDNFWNRAEAVVYSMTVEERRHPEVINGSRRKRIARGSGTTPQEVNRLLNQWKQAKKLAQAAATGHGPSLLKLLKR